MKFKNEKERNKMKQIIQSKKVITIVVVSLLATVSIYSAAPLIVAAGAWATHGQKAFRLLEIGGTFITWGQVGSWDYDPNDGGINDRIVISPKVTEFWTYDKSGIDNGDSPWGSQWDASDFGYNDYDPLYSAGNGGVYLGNPQLPDPWFDVGNYAYHKIDLFRVLKDEETGDYYLGDTIRFADTVWYSKATLQNLQEHPEAAQKKDDWMSWLFSDTWEKEGFWLTYARSERGTYPKVLLESTFKQSGVNDGSLRDKAEEENLHYTATAGCELSNLTWIDDINHPNHGSWIKGGWFYYSETLSFPAYQYGYERVKLCGSAQLIRNIGVSGGKEYWWHTNLVRTSITAQETPITNLNSLGMVVDSSLITTNNWVKKTYTRVLDDRNL
jgi:hypothetical protein